MDTEGHEREVLEGFGTALRKIDWVFVELSKDREVTLRLLLEGGLEGPYQVDFVAHKISAKPVKHTWEDSLFISHRAKSELKSLGFALDEVPIELSSE